MEFLAGTGATIQAATLEDQLYQIIKLIQNFERSETFNPGEGVNMITSSGDDDTHIYSGNCEIYINVSRKDKGVTEFTAPNPYTALPAWSEGDGGQGTAENWVEGLVERAIALSFLERDSTYNTKNIGVKISRITWRMLDTTLTSPVSYNCILSFDFSLDYITELVEGKLYSSATSYLEGSYPGV